MQYHLACDRFAPVYPQGHEVNARGQPPPGRVDRQERISITVLSVVAGSQCAHQGAPEVIHRQPHVPGLGQVEEDQGDFPEGIGIVLVENVGLALIPGPGAHAR